ncbi:hypothetical protein ROSMUCSMR3_03537 [Roseovarius mucosus]|uniref:Bacteriophage T5 Orf172 DNA-binding domain-containing protein n=1 Tax=Roseovarius mucosus TaxID=215743 RepID=A0A1V0RTA1_9RHOB|nr:DUF4041 domain-containing protein [Roseovarius mucosus]ARE84991.1 hypothetical protein ROSMUCSMR3_03537 [Roseovarius mucosus]
MDYYTIGVLVWFLSAPLFFILFLIFRSKLRSTRKQMIDLEASTQRVREQADANVKASDEKYSWITSREKEIERLEASASQLRKDIDELRTSYKDKKSTFDRLRQEVALYDERIAFAELGVYEPHFDFGDSEVFRTAINEVREKQKAMVSAKMATACPTDWTVDGSKSKGAAMINRQTRLTLRAFNSECDAAIANARWNNVNAMEKRILNAEKQINAANASMNLTIRGEYVALKLDELHLTHEYREQQKRERDERAESARLDREEKKLQAEAAAAAAEEKKYQEMLDKARQEVGVDEERIVELERALAEAHEKTERAKSMAEMTKSGYVYIISNVGSFGEDVVKIGLTRRLDPDDRVRELGDASVPFLFDTHAMIYSEEAPALEAALHREFEERRVNAANMRKEFFRVSLEEVEEAVKRLATGAEFFKDREAQEWHETLWRRKQLLSAQGTAEALPDNI